MQKKSTNLKKGIDYPGVSVCCICHDGEGNLLLNKRTKKCRDEWDRWDNWGGGLELGESLEECVRRELAEEGDIVPLKIEYSGQALDVFRTDPKGRPSHWVAIPFAILIKHKNYSSNEPEKLSEVAWFSLNNLPTPRHSHFEKDLGAVAGILSKYQHLRSKKNSLEKRRR